MGKNKELGQEGEQLAQEYLIENGWSIQGRNFRYRHSEIDLIASKNDLLIFVEVKTRGNTAFGMPEDFVDEKQTSSIITAADHFVKETNWTGNIRFDIISIIKSRTVELKHIEDAFY